MRAVMRLDAPRQKKAAALRKKAPSRTKPTGRKKRGG
jgi:hypothetical protein